jgi:hypothetical protein
MLKAGQRVQVGTTATGRIVRVLNGALYEVMLDEPDHFGNTICVYLAEALSPK